MVRMDLWPLLVNLVGVGITNNATQPTNATDKSDNDSQENTNPRSPEVPVVHFGLLQS